MTSVLTLTPEQPPLTRPGEASSPPPEPPETGPPGTKAASLGNRAVSDAVVLLRRPGVLVAVLFLLLVVVSAFLPGLFATHDPYATDPVNKLSTPSAAHLFGTDHVGRDLFSRVIHGSGEIGRAHV